MSSRTDKPLTKMPKNPPNRRFTYNTKFQRALCLRHGMSWKDAVIIDWASHGAAYKDISIWLEMSHRSVQDRLRMAYRLFGLSGMRARLMLVGIRQKYETLTGPSGPSDTDIANKCRS